MLRFLLLILFFPLIPLSASPLVSFYALNCATGTSVLEQNSTLSMMPASCMKIVTTGPALHILGEEFRFETTLEYDGFIKNGTLHGNLYIKGGGDPTLGSDRIAFGWQQQLNVWSESVKKLGIRKIKGVVIGDASKWETAMAVPSWAWEDLGNYYGAGASALSFHENLYSLVFKPAECVGERTTILRTDPPLPFTLQNEVTTGPVGSGDRACIYGSEFSANQIVRGTIPCKVAEFAIKGSLPNPASFCAELLTKALRESGVEVKEEKFLPSKRAVFHTTYSPKLSEIVHLTNQKSINLYAEHLLKKMGEKKVGFGSTSTGINTVKEFWKGQNIDLHGFNMEDGSGLSRKNLVTTKQLAEMLLTLKKSPHFPCFFASLPEQQDNIRAKTGSMSHTKAFVGYAGDIAFAISINHCVDSETMNGILADFFAKLNRVALQ